MNGNGNGFGMDDGVDVEVGTLATIEGSVALEAVDRAAIDVQISTAKKYPRSVDKALKEALTLATLDEETAGSMFYALPRSGKTIEGPSARLAEIMAYSWGNLRVDADIVAEDRTTVTAMGTCFDLEKNVAVRVRVKRRITDKRGVRYNEDMIGVTSNAAVSIALRNCVFKVIPAALTRRIYGEARKASLGKGGTITQKRQKALEWFTKLGITEDQVFEQLGVRGIDDIGEEQLITLRGLVTAIKDGETSVEQIFRPSNHSEGTDELNEALSPKKKAPARKKGGKPIDGEEVTDEDDGSAPTDSQLQQLQDLRDKARAADAMTSEAEASVEAALNAKDGAKVRACIRDLNRSLLAASGELGLEG